MSILNNAKALRNNMTDAEQKLWYHLRAHRFMGKKFKRQKPVGPYVVDFICLEDKLIIELDGGQHADAVEYDMKRDVWLRNEGYTVLRFWNNQLLSETESVLEQIRIALSPSPSDKTTSQSTKPASGQVAGYPTSVRGENI